MIFITGDTHGQTEIVKLSSYNWPQGKTLTKKDYVIIAGDFGLLWKNIPDEMEKYWIKWLNDKPWTTLFVAGNHENYYRLNSLKMKSMFRSVVGKVSDSIFHLKTGFTYYIDGNKIFCFGGASSIDKHHRIENISWWKEEEASFKLCNETLDELGRTGNSVDYVITHTCPTSILLKINQAMKIPIVAYKNGCPENTYINSFPLKDPDTTSKFLQEVMERIEFKKWYFGHFHIDMDIDKFQALYNNIKEIK